MKLLRAILSYLWSTIRHKYNVFNAGMKIVGGIPIWQLLIHDLSKFNPIEYVNYARHYKIDKTDRNAFLRGWMHHQKRNKHHPEFWTSLGISDWTNVSVPMPEKYVREWVADLLGASKEYTGSWDLSAWLQSNLDGWDYCHHDTKRIYAQILQEIGYPVTFFEQEGKLFWDYNGK